MNAHFEALFETGVDEMNWDVVGNDNVSFVVAVVAVVDVVVIVVDCCCWWCCC